MLGDQAFQAQVLVLKLLQSPGLTDLHAPYFARQRWTVVSAMPRRRRRHRNLAPLSASGKTPMICSSVTLLSHGTSRLAAAGLPTYELDPLPG
ncbi:MAG: hypothetical protein J0626_04455, partial [Rhodospirillaceae bacterium]|nr:hypothetical protein [Rhodospirillaceae bacterium]